MSARIDRTADPPGAAHAVHDDGSGALVAGEEDAVVEHDADVDVDRKVDRAQQLIGDRVDERGGGAPGLAVVAVEGGGDDEFGRAAGHVAGDAELDDGDRSQSDRVVAVDALSVADPKSPVHGPGPVRVGSHVSFGEGCGDGVGRGVDGEERVSGTSPHPAVGGLQLDRFHTSVDDRERCNVLGPARTDH
jgi:hypothetical protein